MIRQPNFQSILVMFAPNYVDMLKKQGNNVQLSLIKRNLRMEVEFNTNYLRFTDNPLT